MLDVCLLGTGGMMPLPYRALTSLMVRYNGSSVLIDCGEATQIAVRRQGWSFNPIDLIMITHFHADHISGLPGMLLAMGNAERTEPVTIIGPRGLEKTVRSLLVIAPRLPFKVNCIEIEGDEQEFHMLGLDIKAYKVNHNLLCYGYSISLARAGRFNADAAREKGVPLQCWNRLQHGETVEIDGVTYTPDMVMGEARRGLKVTYTTDTRPTKAIEEAARGADIFICEGMYGEPGDEALAKAREKKHMTMYEAAEIARAANPGEMWLTHFSPSMVNPKQYLDDVRKIFPRTVIGKDRVFKELKFEED